MKHTSLKLIYVAFSKDCTLENIFNEDIFEDSLDQILKIEDLGGRLKFMHYPRELTTEKKTHKNVDPASVTAHILTVLFYEKKTNFNNLSHLINEMREHFSRTNFISFIYATYIGR